MIAKLEGFAALATLAVAAVIGYFIWQYFKGKDVLSVAQDLKANTPLGIPARAIDTTISSATGRDETLGGWLAELFNPATRATATITAPIALPHDAITAVPGTGGADGSW